MCWKQGVMQHCIFFSHTERPPMPIPHSQYGGLSPSGLPVFVDSHMPWSGGEHSADDVMKKNRASYAHDSMAAIHFHQQYHQQQQQGSHRKRAESVDTYTYTRVKYWAKNQLFHFTWSKCKHITFSYIIFFVMHNIFTNGINFIVGTMMTINSTIAWLV